MRNMRQVLPEICRRLVQPGRGRLLKDFFQEWDDTPSDIAWFERLWLGTLAVSVFITISMFDWSVSRVGPYGAAFLTSARFSGTFLLMLFVSRRRSNLARWFLAIPFQLTIIAYDIMRLPDMLHRSPVPLLVLLRLGLMFAAVYMLFTPRSRAWFARRPQPPDD